MEPNIINKQRTWEEAYVDRLIEMEKSDLFNMDENYCQACLCTRYGCTCGSDDKRKEKMAHKFHYSQWPEELVKEIGSILEKHGWKFDYHEQSEWYATKYYENPEDDGSDYFEFGTFHGGYMIEMGWMDPTGGNCWFLKDHVRMDPYVIAAAVMLDELDYRLRENKKLLVE